MHELRQQLTKEQSMKFNEWTVFEQTMAERTQTIRRLTEDQLQLESTKVYFKGRLRLQADLEDELSFEESRCAALNEQSNALMRDLQQASEQVSEYEDRLQETSQRSLELLKQLKDCENEVDTLKSYIIDLKSRIAVYIPVKHDSIDKKLAEYINNYPERSKLKIMFMRESEGIYQFGTKKVYVRVDQDKINIRVGGGFLSIDEFLDQYTPAELEKLERKDPLKRFHEKVAV